MKPLFTILLWSLLNTLSAEIVPVYGNYFKKPLFYSDTSEYRGDVMTRINGRVYIAFWKHEKNYKTKKNECVEAYLIELDGKMNVLQSISLPKKYLKNSINWHKVISNNNKLMLLFSSEDKKNTSVSYYKIDVIDMKLSKLAKPIASFNDYNSTADITCTYSSSKKMLLIECLYSNSSNFHNLQGYIWDISSENFQQYKIKNQSINLKNYQSCLSDQGVVWKVHIPKWRVFNKDEINNFNPLKKTIGTNNSLGFRTLFTRDNNGTFAYIDLTQDSIILYPISCDFVATNIQYKLDKNGYMQCYLSNIPDFQKGVIGFHFIKLNSKMQMMIDSSSFSVSIKSIMKDSDTNALLSNYNYIFNRLLETEDGFICVIERSFYTIKNHTLYIMNTQVNHAEVTNLSDAAIVFEYNHINKTIHQSYCKFDTPENLKNNLEGLLCFKNDQDKYVLAGETQYFTFNSDDIKTGGLLLEYPISNNYKNIDSKESFLYTFTGDDFYMKLYRINYESRFILYEIK